MKKTPNIKYTEKEAFALAQSGVNYVNMMCQDELKKKQGEIDYLNMLNNRLIQENNRLKYLDASKTYIDTQKKYLYTKQKYIDLQKFNNIKYEIGTGGKILIVMIGNMPTEQSVIKHWERFISDADDSLEIVIHPQHQNMRTDILNKWSRIFKKTENFMVCDNNHWVSTGWGNISLALATLIAIEFAMKGKPYNYYKKVVFLQQCIPLYKYAIIKNELLKDSKSWFKPRDGKYPGFEYSQPFNFNRGDIYGATIYDWNWWNAIFALDNSHFNIFFDDKHIDTSGNYTGTYKVDGKYTCYEKEYNNIVSISKNKKYKALFDQVMGSWDWVNPSRTESCINSDEVFFGVAFKNNFPGNTVTDHSRIIDFDAVEKLHTKNIFSNMDIKLPYEFVYLFNDEDKEILKNHTDFMLYGEQPKFSKINKITNLDTDIYVYIPRIVWLDFELYKEKTNYPVYTGIATNYNPEYLKKYNVMRIKNLDYPSNNDDRANTKKIAAILRDNKEISYAYSKNLSEQDIKTHNIMPERIGKFTQEGTYVHKEKNNEHTDEKQYTLQNIHDQPVTYHDWTSFTFGPANIFRDANLSKNDPENRCVKHTSVANAIKLPLDELINDITTHKLKISPGKLPIWHPTEYYTDNLKSIINSYNIMSLCMICKNYTITGDNIVFVGGSRSGSHNDTHNYFNLIKLIKIVWRRCIMLFSDYVIEKFNERKMSYFVINEEMPDTDKIKLENIKVGTCITQDILSSALSVGSLFIRKCTTDSQFNMYSDYVFNIPEYIPNTKDSNKYMDKKDFGEFTYAPKAIFTWEFSRAPHKKGLCHLKLLDVQEDTFTGATYNKTTDVLTIQGDNFAYTEIIGKGTNIAKLYTNNNGYGVVVKHGNTDTILELDITAVDKLKNKKYKSRFINTYVLDRQNILMEPFQGTLISLSADYHYNISLNIVEYIKILNFVATTLAMMSSDSPPLYYSDLKAENILYKCKNKGEYIIKFADTGSITSSPSRIGTYSPPDSDESEKFITWTFGIFIIQLIGGVWINGKYYRRLLKTDKKKLEEYIDDLVSHSKHSIKMFHNLDDSHELFNIIDQTLVRDANNRISISDLANKTETLLNKYLK